MAFKVLGPALGAGLGADFLPGLAGDVGLGGLVSPAIGGALGGALGGGVTGGGKGAAEGALGGFFGGPSLANGGNSLFSGIGNLFGGGGGAGDIISNTGTASLAGDIGNDTLSTPAPAAVTTPAFGGAGGGATAGGVAGSLPTDAVAADPVLDSSLNPAGLTTSVQAPQISSTATGPAGFQPLASAASTAAKPGGNSLLTSLLPKALGAGLLATALGQANKTPPEVSALQKLAAQDQQLGGTIAGQVTPQVLQELAGKLPAAAQQTITAQVAAQKAAIRSKYASMGMSGSTPEIQELAAADQAGVGLAFQTAQSLATTGLSAINQSTGLTGQAAQLQAAILEAQTQQGTALGDALAQFAGALAR